MPENKKRKAGNTGEPTKKTTAKKKAVTKKTATKAAKGGTSPAVVNAEDELQRLWGPVLNGPIHTRDEIALAAADVALEGGDTPIMVYFKEYFAQHPDDPAVAAAAEVFDIHDVNAPWVRGRAETMFQVPKKVEDERPRGTCFEGSFVAVVPVGRGDMLSVPFVCTDDEGDAGLRFAEMPPSEETCGRIAAAFWALLLQAPAELTDYSDRMFESASADWVPFGVQNGEPFMESSAALPDEDLGDDEDDRPALKMTDEDLDADDEDEVVDEFDREPDNFGDEEESPRRRPDDDEDYGDDDAEDEDDADEDDDDDDDDDYDDDDDPPYGFNLDDEDDY